MQNLKIEKQMTGNDPAHMEINMLNLLLGTKRCFCTIRLLKERQSHVSVRPSTLIQSASTSQRSGIKYQREKPSLPAVFLHYIGLYPLLHHRQNSISSGRWWPGHLDPIQYLPNNSYSWSYCCILSGHFQFTNISHTRCLDTFKSRGCLLPNRVYGF